MRRAGSDIVRHMQDLSSSGHDTVRKIAWQDSVWFADIDDTLIDTMSASIPGSEGIRTVFTPHCGQEKAAEIQSYFNAIFKLMLDGYRTQREEDWQRIEGGRQAFEELLSNVESCQSQVKQEFGHVKKWSREVFIKLAAEKARIQVSPELVYEAADAYWLTLTEHIEIFPDAQQLTDTISEHGRPLYLVTSSDARLTMLPNGQFIYDPAYSEALKRQRIELLRAKGLAFNTVSIGDPEDKPHLDFFTKAVRIAQVDLGHPIDCSKAIMLGDSFTGDLQTPKEQLGFGLVVLRESGKNTTEVDGVNQLTVGSLQELANFLQ